MDTLKGPYTGIPLTDVKVPAGFAGMDALHSAWQLALELNATAYGFDEDLWTRAGWQDVLSVRLVGEKRERRIQSVRNIRNVTRRYLEKRVNGKADPERSEPDEVEKALVMTHPMPNGRQLVAITLRGTGGTAREWEPNFACHPTQDVHSGFLSLAGLFADGTSGIALPRAGEAVGEPALTLAMVETELKRPDSRFQLFLTGYSQGGAVMQLYAKKLLDQGVLPDNMLGLGFASPSVAFSAAAPNEHFPLYHLANADDLTPRVGAYRHLGEVWQLTPDDALRTSWYGPDWVDPGLQEFRHLTDSWRHLEQALAFCVQLMRAAIGLPRRDLCTFFAAALDPLKETSTTRSAVAQAQVTARVLLFKAGSEYRAVFGELLPEDDGELTILRRILALGPAVYPRLLWRAMALPHALVRAPEENPASYHDIVMRRLNHLMRVAESGMPGYPRTDASPAAP